MPEHDGLMRVFWPVDIARSELPGVVVGWKNSDLDVTVVAILEDADVRNVDFALKAGTLFRNSAHDIARIYELCGQPNMHVLGLSNAPEEQHTDSSWVRVTTIGPSVRGRIPKVTCARASNIQLILYQRPQPHRMQYISIHPVSLALTDRLSGSKDATKRNRGSNGTWNDSGKGNRNGNGHGNGHGNGNINGATKANGNGTGNGSSVGRGGPAAAAAALLLADDIEAEDERQERLRKEKKQNLLNKLRLHSVVKHTSSPKERALPRIVNQINWAWELELLLQKNVSRIGTRSKRSLSMSERVVESATTMKDTILRWIWELIMLYVVPVITRIFVLGLVGHRIAAEMLLCVLEWRANPRYAALKDISATAQQVEIRLLQFCYWPMQYVKLRQRSNDWESVTTSHPDYIRFYNSLWLVANDVIIGIALGSYIIDNAGWVADQISMLLSTYTVDALQSSISWLMGWPAGLKLNTELAAFLGDLFLSVIEYWSSCIGALRPALPHIIWFIGFSSFAGASMPLALFSDLLSILTIHIYSFYLASARIYHWQLTILISLFHLFRGKKHNVLRNRIDSCDYDLDQLLVGTILFTFLFFLLPTVVVFYLNFAVARMVIISLKAVFDTLLSCLNHFPLFALMLRVKDPRRLPGGIRFELRDSQSYNTTMSAAADATDSSSPSHPSTSVIFLTPIPLSFKAMFHQYFQMGSRIRKHYLAPRVLLCLLTGKFVPPINRKNLYSLQYVMLPGRRAGIWEMWEALKSLPPLKTKRVAYPDIGGGRRMRGQSVSGGIAGGLSSFSSEPNNRRARR
ncbi:phosphatidylinositol glycan, class Q [Sporothrix brasiliensis 5110]|uniref:Phosphatidylinositol glycan, class Q n=1 Tax=Sporothrix brasiliensis 5110 TaxID=1398154 RepID=A0A0C2ERL6_9PEZI|nr:phosphatidylinositol glycan, class Q [Sporothrix brasiliensis 5110]KIH89014.1 phosphatidylinositol glycan, class Q [Sporothrix brasiliensis 5110]